MQNPGRLSSSTPFNPLYCEVPPDVHIYHSEYPGVVPFMIVKQVTPLAAIFAIAIATGGRNSQADGMPMVQYTSLARTTMVVKDGYVSIHDLGDTVRGCLKEFSNIVYNSVTFGLNMDDELFGYCRDLSKIKDDPQCFTPGYSFLSDDRNDLHLYADVLLERLFGNAVLGPRFALDTAKGKVIRAGVCREWLRNANKAAQWVLIAMHIAGGQPQRGTEIACLNRVNCPGGSGRGSMIQYGLFTVIAAYNKTQNKVSNACYCRRGRVLMTHNLSRRARTRSLFMLTLKKWRRQSSFISQSYVRRRSELLTCSQTSSSVTVSGALCSRCPTAQSKARTSHCFLRKLPTSSSTFLWASPSIVM